MKNKNYIRKGSPEQEVVFTRELGDNAYRVPDNCPKAVLDLLTEAGWRVNTDGRIISTKFMDMFAKSWEGKDMPKWEETMPNSKFLTYESAKLKEDFYWAMEKDVFRTMGGPGTWLV